MNELEQLRVKNQTRIQADHVEDTDEESWPFLKRPNEYTDDVMNEFELPQLH